MMKEKASLWTVLDISTSPGILWNTNTGHTDIFLMKLDSSEIIQ
jgi:hypothetical protein